MENEVFLITWGGVGGGLHGEWSSSDNLHYQMNSRTFENQGINLCGRALHLQFSIQIKLLCIARKKNTQEQAYMYEQASDLDIVHKISLFQPSGVENLTIQFFDAQYITLGNQSLDFYLIFFFLTFNLQPVTGQAAMTCRQRVSGNGTRQMMTSPTARGAQVTLVTVEEMKIAWNSLIVMLKDLSNHYGMIYSAILFRSIYAKNRRKCCRHFHFVIWHRIRLF